MKKDLLRIIDANLNRSREALRVCEEITRFILADRNLTAGFKFLRHKISRTISELPQMPKSLVDSRDSRRDVGKGILTAGERKNYKDVFFANVQRAKESLRVLEEFCKIFNHSLSNKFARLRFKTYELEKKTSAKLLKKPLV